MSPRIKVLLQLPAVLRRYIPLARPGWKLPLATFLLMLVSAALDAFGISLLVPLIDLLQGGVASSGRTVWILDKIQSVFPGRPREALLAPYVGLVVAAFTLRALAAWSVILTVTRLTGRISGNMREALCGSLLTARPEVFDRTKGGELNNLFTNHLGFVVLGFENLVQVLFRGTLILSALVYVVLESWQVALLLVVIILLVGGPVALLQAPIKRRGAHQGSLQTRFAGLLNDVFTGMRVIRFSGAQPEMFRRFRGTVGELGHAEITNRRIASLVPILLEFFALISVMLIILISFHWLIREKLLAANELLGILLAASRMVPNLNQVATAYGLLSVASGYMEQLEPWFRLPRFPTRPFGVREFGGIGRELRFDSVDFSYTSDRPALTSVSFEVPSGAKVALVGASGSGKSTVAALLMRLREPTAGCVRVDGVDYWEFSAESWQRHLGVVEQEPFLFHESIRANLTFGLPDVSPERIAQAIRTADLDAVIAAQPQGLDTVIGERGATLSGGQRQRLAIARAVARDPRLLILDEATSALDTATEREVQKALDAAMSGRTTLIIAHRLSTVRNADRIVVFDQGRVVEQGTWDDLTGRDGPFARLVRLNELKG